MSNFMPSGHGRLALQFCAAAAVAALMGGCSTDATRLSDPFTNPFATASNDPAPPPPRSHAYPTGRTPPVVSQALPARSSAVATAAPLRPQVMTAYNTARVSHETTGSIEPAHTAPGASSGGWTSSGGVAITVGDGESADDLSKRYGVPTAALLQTNGYRSASEIRPGSRLTIPVYNAVAAAQHGAPHMAQAEPPRSAPVRMAEAPRLKPMARAALLKPKAERMAAAAQRTPGRTVVAARPIAPARLATVPAKELSRTPLDKRPPAHLARAELGKDKTAQANPAHGKDTALRQAALRPEAAQPTAKPAGAKPAPVKTATLAPAVATAPIRTARAAAKPAPLAAAKTDPTPTASVAAAAPVSDASGNPEFRWPARGRIIQAFKGGSGGNDGINIAVPEGTAVKAAEGGTVAYAGSELKGYGNLVLIRHPNGFVSAYANNGEIDVKRGDQVKRGQTIAKSGQSGNVASPQLHFELRKGSTPVDPTQYLANL